MFIEDDQGNHLLIDPCVDLRQQFLRENIADVRDILVTHLHADHIFGLNEVRIFNKKYNHATNLYLEQGFNCEIREVFRYIYNPPDQIGGGLPQVNNVIIKPGKTFEIADFKITPFRVFHGRLPITGFRINNIAYITDSSVIPEESYQYLEQLDVLVLNALRERKHPTHFSISESVEQAQKIGAKQTLFTHIDHDLEHEKTNSSLPKNIQLAYDGQVIIV